MGGHLCPHWSATNGQLKHKNSCPYWGQGGLHRSVCTCSPSGLRWPCTGAGILFCTRRQKWTLSHLRGFEGRHGRYHGSEETEQWIIVSSRTLAVQSHKWCSSCCSTDHTVQANWVQLSLLGEPVTLGARGACSQCHLPAVPAFCQSNSISWSPNSWSFSAPALLA